MSVFVGLDGAFVFVQLTDLRRSQLVAEHIISVDVFDHPNGVPLDHGRVKHHEHARYTERENCLSNEYANELLYYLWCHLYRAFKVTEYAGP